MDLFIHLFIYLWQQAGWVTRKITWPQSGFCCGRPKDREELSLPKLQSTVLHSAVGTYLITISWGMLDPFFLPSSLPHRSLEDLRWHQGRLNCCWFARVRWLVSRAWEAWNPTSHDYLNCCQNVGLLSEQELPWFVPKTRRRSSPCCAMLYSFLLASDWLSSCQRLAFFLPATTWAVAKAAKTRKASDCFILHFCLHCCSETDWNCRSWGLSIGNFSMPDTHNFDCRHSMLQAFQSCK